ncbi:1,4-dihydroxy-2-naphthoate polyprenyltransferase [Indibacter alkaliphilus LW1]|uniref:1,4-dihydroxy-2-naphthoate octaprenyltransferase n=1 Tax=Indibacter alkaliphilus (strain CCUG 57479 / KCTC 22604 / LW1) TaxID=1189612 RepID=S2D837_INDAL|nr:1,4-dihydroxy-2-naphthoate polyprenyltransferase [Indibacter alkaliphilus]EOZ95382.1 1,4-dihydroxy-2-naphthoate polyprenyltransferase [Indibacter alkaliphilus LW1]
MEVTLINKKQAWLHAIRLRTLPLALSSILMGSFLAAFHQSFRWDIFVLAALTTVFLQVLSNLANDYGDSVHGADSQERQGPIRAVQSGIISLAEMKRAMIILAALSFFSGILLLYLALGDWKLFLLFLGFGLLAIYAAITYTSGSNPYGYVGLGDISVFIFFGLLGVIGTYFLHSLDFNWSVILPAVSLGAFSTAVLNINNIRDIKSDIKAGKRSIPVRIGRKAAVSYNWFLILSGNILLPIFAVQAEQWGVMLAWLILPFMLFIGMNIQRKTEAMDLDPFLKKMAISTLLWVLLFGIGLILL